MAIFLLRGKYTKEAYQSLMESPIDRETAFEKVLDKFGMRMVSWFYSPADSGWVSICEGTHEQLAAVEIFSGASGRNTSFTAELLISGNDLAQSAKSAAIVKI